METKYELWYKKWCGTDRHLNDCKPVHDSSEAIEFAEYCSKENIPLESPVIKGVAQPVNFTEDELKYIKILVAEKFGDIMYKSMGDKEFREDHKKSLATVAGMLDKVSKISL